MAEPLDPPLQDTFVCAAVAVLITVGCVIVKLRVAVLPFDVIEQVYVPAAKPVAVAAVPPEGDQE